MSIPVSDIVSVNPGVISSGGSPLALNGVILSKNTLLPTGTVQSFVSPDSVSLFFGASSSEKSISETYFLGFDNSTIKPGTLYFAPYNDAARAAWLKSGSFTGVQASSLTSLTGTLNILMDGGSYGTSTSISLTNASTFGLIATAVQSHLNSSKPGGAGDLVVGWHADIDSFTITSSTTGASSTVAYATGTAAAGLKFTSATGSSLSQGAVVDTPSTAMNNVKAATQNWVDFTTIWEPDLDNKKLFSVWTNSQNQRYMYVPWDTDIQAVTNGSTTAFGVVAKGLAYDGVVPVYNTKELAAFVLGCVASIDFSRTNGRITTAFKSQSGFLPTVTDQQLAANLLANGYSFYGKYATANDQFNFLYNGQMAGKWKWVDTFVDQVYLNSQLQLALISLLTSVKSIPYNEAGYSLIRAAMTDPITQALNFGSIRTGITMSESQKAQVNQSAGKEVSAFIGLQGYYLQILDPGAQVRGLRGTPVINFWYTDGGAVQKINIASIDIM